MTDKYPDSLKRLHQNLKEIRDKYEALVKSGIDKEILEIYLMHKTKLSKAKVKEVLGNINAFFDKLVNDEFVKQL